MALARSLNTDTALKRSADPSPFSLGCDFCDGVRTVHSRCDSRDNAFLGEIHEPPNYENTLGWMYMLYLHWVVDIASMPIIRIWAKLSKLKWHLNNFNERECIFAIYCTFYDHLSRILKSTNTTNKHVKVQWTEYLIGWLPQPMNRREYPLISHPPKQQHVTNWTTTSLCYMLLMFFPRGCWASTLIRWKHCVALHMN